MAGWVMPVIGMAMDMLFSRGRGRQEQAVHSQEGKTMQATVTKVGQAVERLLEQDERMVQLASAEVQDARRHDSTLTTGGVVLVDVARGLVRPGITLAVFVWYIYARVNGIALSAEDYALVGGVLAFWFGMRMYEKTKIQ